MRRRGPTSSRGSSRCSSSPNERPITGPNFALDATNAHTVGELCRRLDGVPLAIELAAARLRSMSVDEIERRLDDRFSLLTSGSRSALPRQQTLHAVIDWSYDLLTDFDRLVLDRLSVFAGSFDADAAAAVCAADDVTEAEALDRLSALVDKSLVEVEPAPTSADGPPPDTRYRLLETVRQYADERLTTRGDAEAAADRSRHREWFARLAERAAAERLGDGQVRWIELLEVDADNLRAALETAAIDGDGQAQGLRLVASLHFYWGFHRFGVEASDLINDLLAQTAGSQLGKLRGSSVRHRSGPESDPWSLLRRRPKGQLRLRPCDCAR